MKTTRHPDKKTLRLSFDFLIPFYTLRCLSTPPMEDGSVIVLDMQNRFERNPYRELPDGAIAKVYPFHFSLEGLETRILCREGTDYDAFVKIICICARRTNVILVIYAVVSTRSFMDVHATYPLLLFQSVTLGLFPGSSS